MSSLDYQFYISIGKDRRNSVNLMLKVYVAKHIYFSSHAIKLFFAHLYIQETTTVLAVKKTILLLEKKFKSIFKIDKYARLLMWPWPFGKYLWQNVCFAALQSDNKFSPKWIMLMNMAWLGVRRILSVQENIYSSVLSYQKWMIITRPSHPQHKSTLPFWIFPEFKNIFCS